MSSRSNVQPAQPASADASRAFAPSRAHRLLGGAARAWAWARTHDGQKRIAWTLVALFIVLFVWQVSSHTLMRYWAYHTDAFDLGNMDQAVWNTLHGHPFRFTNVGLDWYGPPTRLGIHVEPILLLIAPLYLLHSGPETLIVLQTVALGLGALPLFLLCLRRLPELPLLGAAFAGAYLLAPELLGEAVWDFHPVALATPLMLLAVWAVDARRYGWFIAAAVLAALTKEDVALALLPLGVYIAVWQRRPRLGLATVALSLAWVALCFGLILPHFHGTTNGGNNYWYRYNWLGSSPGGATLNVLTHPWLPFAFVLGNAAKRGYLAMLLRTAGGLGVLAPALWLCGLPELAVNLLSTHDEQYSGVFQYNAVLLAFLVSAAVYGAEALYRARHSTDHLSRGKRGRTETTLSVGNEDTQGGTSWGTRLAANVRATSDHLGAWWGAVLARLPIPARAVAPVLILWLLIASVWNLTAASLTLVSFWNSGDAQTQNQGLIDALLARVPPSATVAATDTLDSHLSDRYTLYLMPDPRAYSAQYVAVDVRDAIAQSRTADEQMYAAMLASGHYTIVGTVYSAGSEITLLRRIASPVSLTPAAPSPSRG